MTDRRHSLILSLICAIVLLGLLVPAVQATQADAARDAAQSIVDGIIAYKTRECSAENVQELLSGELAKTAGSSEWYVLSLAQSGEYDLSAYRSSLLSYLDSATVASAPSRQKYALLLVAAGAADDEYVTEVMESSVGEGGLMSFVFALHLMNNGCESSRYSPSEVVRELVLLQKDDGGWSVLGEAGDVDATAMTVQALAPVCGSENDDGTCSEAVERALEFLSERQRESGGYASFGVENAESSAQVLCALSALGIDAATDERFIKDGQCILDALESFKLPDGSFCHTLGGTSNESATVQSLYGALSYVRMCDGRSPFYILDSLKTDGDKVADTTDTVQAADTDEAPTATSDDTADTVDTSRVSPKLVIIAVLVGAAGCAVILLAIFGRLGKKTLTLVLLVLVLLVALVAAADIKSADDYYSPDGEKDVTGHVTLTIRCDTVAGQCELDSIPEDGMILESAVMPIGEGDTVYDVLVAAAREYHLQLDASSSGSAYVKGIAYLYEYDFGELSGWMYAVNGELPSVSAAELVLSDGDSIAWLYTCELGRDLELS